MMVFEYLDKQIELKTLGYEEHEYLRNKSNERGRIGESIKRINKLPFENTTSYYTDNEWVFIDKDKERHSLPDVKLIFGFAEKSINNDFFKKYVIDELIKSYNKKNTIQSKLYYIKRFYLDAEELFYNCIEDIPLFFYVNYFENLQMSYSGILSFKGALLSFLKFYQLNYKKIRDEKILEYLEERDVNKLKAEIENGKTPALPEDFRIRFINECVRIMNDESAILNNRIVAASLVLNNEIGIRTGELGTITTDSLEEVRYDNDKRIFYYLNFKTYKKSYGDSGYRDAHSFMTKRAIEAYNVLLSICSSRRKYLKTNSLIISEQQTTKTIGPKSFLALYKGFLYDYYEVLNLDTEYEGFKTTTLDKLNTKTKKREGDNDKEVFYPEIRQFRVTKCTELYKHNVPIRYIRMHMTHLTEEMTEYYIREEKIVDKDISKKIYRAIFEDDAKLLGCNSDVFIEKVKSYLEGKGINVVKDVNKAVELAGEKFPLRSKLGGICIRCGNVIPCVDDKITDKAFCSYDICPNHCHMYFMADISYKRVKEQLEIIKSNEERGFEVATKKEKNKIKYIIKNALIPELEDLDNIIKKKSKEEVIGDFPQLSEIIDNYKEIYEEVKKWI